jgi:hypothetical protein
VGCGAPVLFPAPKGATERAKSVAPPGLLPIQGTRSHRFTPAARRPPPLAGLRTSRSWYRSDVVPSRYLAICAYPFCFLLCFPHQEATEETEEEARSAPSVSSVCSCWLRPFLVSPFRVSV